MADLEGVVRVKEKGRQKGGLDRRHGTMRPRDGAGLQTGPRNYPHCAIGELAPRVSAVTRAGP